MPNEGRQSLNLQIKNYYNNICNSDLQNIYTPHTMKIYKAMSYKNVLSKSLPKHLKDKNKIYFPIKNKIFAYSSQKNIKENNIIINLLE